MEFDFSWLLFGLPLAFGMGWFASRLDLQQMRMENSQAPKAYFKGLNYLLNEQQDQAIDAFIEAVQNDPDTSELHFALGNLFRRRGEYERAVRVHEHLLARADLSVTDRTRAQHALALDFLKAGLLDRAEDALRKLNGTAFAAEAGMALLAIYERTRDWAQADAIAAQLEATNLGNFSVRRAHYLCEQSRWADAHALGADSARPALGLAQWQAEQGQTAAAFTTLVDLAQRLPQAMPLIAKPVAALVKSTPALRPQAVDLLRTNYEASPSLDVMEVLAELDSDGGARNWYLEHLQRIPSLVAAAKWIEGEKLEHEQFHPQVQRALDHAVKPLTRYRCAACGFEAQQHFWQCPGCQTWDSYPVQRVEEL